MENDNLGINKILNAKSVKELDSFKGVQLLVLGPEKHREMIIDYNRMIADYGSIYHKSKFYEDELLNLRSASGLVRLFKGKSIDARIAELEKQLAEADAEKASLDKFVEDALKCIQRFEEELKEAEKQVIAAGYSVAGVVSMYNKKRRELIYGTRESGQKDSAEAQQRGE